MAKGTKKNVAVEDSTAHGRMSNAARLEAAQAMLEPADAVKAEKLATSQPALVTYAYLWLRSQEAPKDGLTSVQRETLETLGKLDPSVVEKIKHGFLKANEKKREAKNSE